MKYILLTIQSGKMVPGQKLLSERQYAIKFNTTQATVKKVIQKLVTARVLYTVYRKGYYVARNNFVAPVNTIGLGKEALFEQVKKELSAKEQKEIVSILKKHTKYKDLDKFNFKLLINSIDGDEKKFAFSGYRKDILSDEFVKDNLSEYYEPEKYNAKLLYSLTDNVVVKRIDKVLQLEKPSFLEIGDYTSMLSKVFNQDGELLEFILIFVKRDSFKYIDISSI